MELYCVSCFRKEMRPLGVIISGLFIEDPFAKGNSIGERVFRLFT